MANLLPLDAAIKQADSKAEAYAAALHKLRGLKDRNSEKFKRTRAEVQKAYSDLSSAQWELEQYLK